jgi:hypothetical protein
LEFISTLLAVLTGLERENSTTVFPPAMLAIINADKSHS